MAVRTSEAAAYETAWASSGVISSPVTVPAIWQQKRKPCSVYACMQGGLYVKRAVCGHIVLSHLI